MHRRINISWWRKHRRINISWWRKHQRINISWWRMHRRINISSWSMHQRINISWWGMHQRISVSWWIKLQWIKTCRWICLTTNYPLTPTGQYEDKMTENQMCIVEQTWQQSQNSLTLVGSLKTEACLIWKPLWRNR